MKKILSMALSLALVFSMCSISLMANAESGITRRYYSFNDDSFYVEIDQGVFPGDKRTACYIYFVEIEGYYRNEEGVVDGGDGDLEYIIEEFLPTVYTSYQRSITTNVYFIVNKYSSPDSRLDENGISYIISEINPTNLVTFEIEGSRQTNNDVKSMTPVIDALYATCNNTLKRFAIRYSSGITEIDERIFTDFPSIESVNLDGCVDCFEYEEPVRITIGQYKVQYCLIKVTSEVAEKVIWEQYDWDEEAFLRDYYFDNIYTHLNATENVTVRTCSSRNGNLKIEHYYTCNGITAHIGCDIECSLVYEGDVTGDGYIDSFDVATATDYVNSFEDPEDEAVKMAMDIVSDGYIDATDLAYISYIANYEG